MIFLCKEGSSKSGKEIQKSFDGAQVDFDPNFGTFDEISDFLNAIREKNCNSLKTMMNEEFLVEFNGYEALSFRKKDNYIDSTSNSSVCAVFFDTQTFRTALVKKGVFKSDDFIDNLTLSVVDYPRISDWIYLTEYGKGKAIYFSRKIPNNRYEESQNLLYLHLRCPQGIN